MEDYYRFLRTLFREGEHLCVTNSPSGTRVSSLALALEPCEAPANFVCVNPLRGDRDLFPVEPYHAPGTPRRADHNVTEYRNLLFEFDSGTIEQQMAEIVGRGVPFTSLVYSGGKSLHCVISLEDGVSREVYDNLWRRIGYVLWMSDPTAKNPSRLTRAAGAVRDNGVLQELVELRKPVSLARVEQWLGRFHRHIANCEERERARLAERAAKVTGGGIGSLSASALRFLDGELGNTKSRHTRMVAIAFELMEAGLEYDDVLNRITAACDLHGITADPKRLQEPLKIVNYVFGKRR